MEKVIGINNSHIYMKLYDKKFNELEDGTYFGVIVDESFILSIMPCTELLDGNLVYTLSSGPELFEEDLDDEEEQDEKIVHEDYISKDRDLVLIFQKIGENLAVEILSKKTFIINGRANYIDEDLDTEQFQKALDMYSDVYLALEPCSKAVDDKKYLDDAYFVVNDIFKREYYNNTLRIKDEIIKSFNAKEKIAKGAFDCGYKSLINEFHTIALADNEIYDYEHSKQKIKK